MAQGTRPPPLEVRKETRTTTLAGAADTTTTLGGGGATTTALAQSTTTTADQGDAGVGLEDIPPECLDVLVEFLLRLQPVVADVDWENATIEVHIMVANELGAASIDDVSGCDHVDLDTTDEGSSDLVIDLAQRDAPGTVGYLESIRSMTASLDGTEVSGAV